MKEERIIFIIDEGQFIDSASWTFMEKLIRSVPIFIIMSLSPFVNTPCAAASAIMKNRNTTYVTLGPYVLAAMIYFCINFPANKAIEAVERRMRRGDRR